MLCGVGLDGWRLRFFGFLPGSSCCFLSGFLLEALFLPVALAPTLENCLACASLAALAPYQG